MVNPEMKEFSPGERLIRSWRGKGIWNLIAAQPITSGHKYPLMNHKFLSPDKKRVRIAVTETIDQSGQDTHWKERIKSCYILPVRSFGLIMLW